MPKTIEIPAVELVPNGYAYGYRPKPSVRRIYADPEHWPEVMEKVIPMWPAEGCEPFWADVRDDLTFNDIEQIPMSAGATFQTQMDVIAPWIVAWNAEAYEMTTNRWQPVPPPADIGPDALKTQRSNVTSFIALCLSRNFGTNIPKELQSSSDTDDGSVSPT